MLDFSKFPQASSSLPLILCTALSLSIRFFNFFQLLHIFSTFQFFPTSCLIPPSFLFTPSSFLHHTVTLNQVLPERKARLRDNRRMHIATIIKKHLRQNRQQWQLNDLNCFWATKRKKKCVDIETLFNTICLSTLCASLFQCSTMFDKFWSRYTS